MRLFECCNVEVIFTEEPWMSQTNSISFYTPIEVELEGSEGIHREELEVRLGEMIYRLLEQNIKVQTGGEAVKRIKFEYQELTPKVSGTGIYNL